MFSPNYCLVAFALLLAPVVPATSLRQSPSSEAPKKAEGTPSESTAQDSSAIKANGAGAPQADFSQEPVVYEYRHTVLRYENDGTGYRETHGRVHVQTSAGLRLGEFTIFYNAENESAEIISLRVIKPDGSVITAGPSDVQDLSAPLAQGAPMYTLTSQVAKPTINAQNGGITSLEPTSAQVKVGQSKNFKTVGGTGDIDWQVNGKDNGDSTTGTIDNTGKYTAPAAVPAPPDVTITAISKSDGTKATATVTILH
jgi:hypothetical protein